jgi:hypothetical protein
MKPTGGVKAQIRCRLARLGFACTLCATALPTDAAPLSRPDTFLARVQALASMETLNAEILGSRSATKTLESWCATHAMATAPKIVAARVTGVDKPIGEDQRKRLAIGPDEPVKYRRVKLTCGTHVLSEADNWYVPSRLTPEMNQLLETTDTPFGKAVASLGFTRETFAADLGWHVLPPDWEMVPPAADHPDAPLDIPPVLFEHRAVLFDSHHRPFSEVDEHYTREILAFDGAH